VKLIRHWNSDVFEPLVIAFDDGELRKELVGLGIKLIILKKGEGLHLRFLYQLLARFRQLKPDLVHCRNASPVVIYGGIAAKVSSLPLVVSVHGHSCLLENDYRLKAWYKIQNFSNKVITVSGSIKRELIVAGGVNPGKITVIHNGIDLAWAKPELREQKRRELGLNGSKLIIGCVGNLKPVKGHEYLIRAVPLVLSEFPDARFILVGDGPLRNELELLASRLNVKDSVIFLGNRMDVHELMPVFDVFALPSLSEGLCNVLLEAMLAEKPVVATNVGGNPEVVEDGKTGILVHAREPSKLAKAIVSLLGNAGKRREMGRMGLLKVKKEFQFRKTIEEYEKIYLDLCYANTSKSI